MNKKLRLKITLLLALIMAIAIAAPVHAEQSQEDMAAFNAAMELYDNRNSTAPVENGIQDAIDAFASFIETYPEYELNYMAQEKVGWCYLELGNTVSAKEAFNKLITDYPGSNRTDDAKYQLACIDYKAGDYEAARTGFHGVIDEYEGNKNDKLIQKVPFSYFMIGESYRLENKMDEARAIWGELIAKYPKHSHAKLANTRINP